MRNNVCRDGHATNNTTQFNKEGIRMVRRIIFLVSITVLVLALSAGSALAYSDYGKYVSKGVTGPGGETSPVGDGTVDGAYALGCYWCHGWDKIATPNQTTKVDLTKVLTDPGVTSGGYTGSRTDTTTGIVNGQAIYINLLAQYSQPYGPHGGYSNTTDRCKVCHDVHASQGSKKLLPQNTVADICETCHDFTEGISIYGAIKANGDTVAASHEVPNLSASAAATLVPGGSLSKAADPYYPNTGGTVAYNTLSLASGETALTCTDCHTPHGNTSMRPFKGDRVRLGSAILAAAACVQPANITRINTYGAASPAFGLPDGTDLGPAGPLGARRLYIAKDSPIYDVTTAVEDGRALSSAGTAFAVSLVNAGALAANWETATAASYGSPTDYVPASLAGLGAGTDILLLKNAYLTRVPSNKLLRDYINGVDLRSAKFGGTAPSSAWATGTASTYVEVNVADGNGSTTGTQTIAPYDNGQGGATAEYGSGFCFACHQGRIGNWRGGQILDNDFATVGDIGNQATVLGVAASTAATMGVDGVNHPTSMKVAYRNVATAGGNGMALTNQGFVMFPVNPANHPDGELSQAARNSQGAPICQQCHEDARDLGATFSYGDTDKKVPFGGPVNGALAGAIGGLNTGGAGTGALFIAAGNPKYQNFPHETANLRLLVEGGDSTQVGGGNNDNLCLNCHVPGSAFRFQGGVGADKNLSGWME
jgi:predicted CXXCH cytochrome family protein